MSCGESVGTASPQTKLRKKMINLPQYFAEEENIWPVFLYNTGQLARKQKCQPIQWELQPGRLTATRKRMHEGFLQIILYHEVNMRKQWRFGILLIPIFLLMNCGLFDTQLFNDADSGFSIWLPSEWERVNPSSLLGDYESAELKMDASVYMNTETMADAFIFVKIEIPDEFKGQSADQILREVMPSFYNDELMKYNLTGHEVYTFLDSIGPFNSAQGGFIWVRNDTLHYANIRVFNGSHLEDIYRSAMLK